MASSSRTCITSILDDLQALEVDCPKSSNGEKKLPYLKALKNILKFLKTFLLCANLRSPSINNKNEEIPDKHPPTGTGTSLEALLFQIEETISKTAKDIHSSSSDELSKVVLHLRIETEIVLGREISQWYVFFSSDRSTSSDHPNSSHSVMEFLDSLLENVARLPKCLHYKAELIEALEEKLQFWNKLIRFVKLHGVEDAELGPLLIHVESVAIDAARISFRCYFRRSFETPDEINESISQLLLKNNIFPLKPGGVVRDSCIQALIASSNLSRQYGDTDLQILRDFVDSLLLNLGEMLKSGGVIISLSLNAIQHGLLLSKDMDLVPSGLLERIGLIEAVVAQRFSEESSFDFPKTDGLGFLNLLLEKMTDLKRTEASSNSAFMEFPFQTVQEELVFFRSFVEKIVELREEDQEIKAIWDRVVEVAYRVEFLIDSLIVGDVLDSSSFDSFVEEIKRIKDEALNISDSGRLIGCKAGAVTKRFNDQMPLIQGSKAMINDVVVGFEDEATSIINRLKRGSHQRKIVSIVGMPGLGKTTLARKVYNDSSVKSYFHQRAWITVSQAYHMKILLLQILTCIESKLPNNNVFEMNEEDLALQVKRSLLRNRYLIVLDDVWDTEAWNGLEASFPDDGNGSRVILTSRLRDVTPQDKLDQEPHSLRQLTPDESWDLLNTKLFPEKDLPDPPEELCDLRQQVVEMCQGVPLTVIILAGILSSMDRFGWKDIVEGLSSRKFSSTEQCSATLELSYKNLPDNLKACFLYFGAFPEDHEHDTKRLISLWVAEGFVPKTQLKRLEDVANDFLMELINRSLIMVSKPSSTGGVKALRVHDLLHEFCVNKAREEKLLQLVCTDDELAAFNQPCYLRRFCIDSKHFDKLRLTSFSPAIRSLLCFSHGENPEQMFDLRLLFHIIKLVTVLDLSHIKLTSFPKEMELLVHLRYLAILDAGGPFPSSICNLSNLETLVWHNSWLRSSVTLPDTIWDLKKLRRLRQKDDMDRKHYGFSFPVFSLDSSPQLCNLDSLSRLSLNRQADTKKLFKKFPNIRRLRCYLYSIAGDEYNVPMDRLSQLESLSLSCYICGGDRYPFDMIQFPLSIKKLTLSCFRWPWSEMAAIGSLPNLEVLKLLEQAFEGEMWEMEVEMFPTVRFLKLDSLNIVKWTASSEYEDHFPSLQKLVLESCDALQEIPSFLGNSSSLEIIEVSNCPNCISSLEEIQEEQLSMGNTDLKILVS